MEQMGRPIHPLKVQATHSAQMKRGRSIVQVFILYKFIIFLLIVLGLEVLEEKQKAVSKNLPRPRSFPLTIVCL